MIVSGIDPGAIQSSRDAIRLLPSLLSKVGANSVGLIVGGDRPGVVGSLLVAVWGLKMKAAQIRTGSRESGASVQCLAQAVPGNYSGHPLSLYISHVA